MWTFETICDALLAYWKEIVTATACIALLAWGFYVQARMIEGNGR